MSRTLHPRSLPGRALLRPVFLTGSQFEVGRELRARVASAFRYEGINISADLETGRATGGAS